MAKKQALGRGLGELLGEVEKAYEKNLNVRSEDVIELSADIIKPNPYQPRKTFKQESLQELAMSITEHGLLQPILVYEDEGDYFLIAGERRLRASKIAKQSTIKAIIADVPKDKLRELAIIENIQRENLNPIDLAISYKELIDSYHITHDELAKKLKISRTQITNTLRILELSEYTQNLILENKISQGHAKIMVGLSQEEQKILADSIIGQRLSVRETENLVKTIKAPNQKPNKPINKKPQLDLQKLQEVFSDLGIQNTISKDTIIIKPTKEKIDYLIKKLKS